MKVYFRNKTVSRFQVHSPFFGMIRKILRLYCFLFQRWEMSDVGSLIGVKHLFGILSIFSIFDDPRLFEKDGERAYHNGIWYALHGMRCVKQVQSIYRCVRYTDMHLNSFGQGFL